MLWDLLAGLELSMVREKIRDVGGLLGLRKCRSLGLR